MKYRVIVEQDESGWFVAECPSLPGCVSQGKTRADALENIRDAIDGYIASLEKHGDPVPPAITEEIVDNQFKDLASRIMLHIFVFLLLSISGCASSYYLNPAIDYECNQSSYYYNGKEIAVSKLEKTTILLYIRKTERDELLVHIKYENNSAGSINVLPDLIQIDYFDRNGNSKNMIVYTAENYIKKLKRGQAWNKFSMALNAALQSYNAGTSTTTGTVGGQSVYLKTNDPAKKAIVDKQNREEIQKYQRQTAILNASVEHGLVKRNTLSSGFYVEGNVMAKFRDTDSFYITVPFGAESHKFEFSRP